MPDPEESEREAIATLIQECFPTGAGGYSVIWEDCLPAADAILTARRLSESEIRREDVNHHVDAWADTGDGYTSNRMYVTKCLWCDFRAEAPLHRDAKAAYDKHVDQIQDAATQFFLAERRADADFIRRGADRG